jgi:hypothetical protein
MIFTEPLHSLVLSGRKTQTRRPVQPSDVWQPNAHTGEITMVQSRPWHRTRFFVGHDYAVQPGRGKKSTGRIRVTRLRYVAQAMDISEADARAEGFETPDAFREKWREMYGELALACPCWALDFELIRKREEKDADGTDA